MTRKNAALYLASLCVLCAGYLLCRYVFFAVHGMKQWPACLFLLGLVISIFRWRKISAEFRPAKPAAGSVSGPEIE